MKNCRIWLVSLSCLIVTLFSIGCTKSDSQVTVKSEFSALSDSKIKDYQSLNLSQLEYMDLLDKNIWAIGAKSLIINTSSGDFTKYVSDIIEIAESNIYVPVPEKLNSDRKELIDAYRKIFSSAVNIKKAIETKNITKIKAENQEITNGLDILKKIMNKNK